VTQVDAGSRLVKDAGATMEQVEQSIRRVTSIVNEISNASQEQSTGIAEVGGAVSQMDQATQQNAALVEQAAAAAHACSSRRTTWPRWSQASSCHRPGRKDS